ncbi:hypothetical protein QBC35DRAFT_448801 [Podospora australis]|uniref:Uncharacterized protein n=1 Tax=Podospora australis TaxID=1536484 RepID=A0AAN6WZ51_9PEZI|nr:hypothetical protein QBC35DRAFT_448801 [Podospora australis]
MKMETKGSDDKYKTTLITFPFPLILILILIPSLTESRPKKFKREIPEMKILLPLLALAAVATALPERADHDLKVWLGNPRNVIPAGKEARSASAAPDPEEEMESWPILDARIDSHEKEKRTANLSPMNNPREGLFPRACTSDSKCPCASNARTGLWCGYCTSPVEALPECRSGQACMDKVYQCGPGRDCCTFGRRTSCANRRGPCGG